MPLVSYKNAEAAERRANVHAYLRQHPNGVRMAAVVRRFVSGDPTLEENRKAVNRLAEALAVLVREGSADYLIVGGRGMYFPRGQ